MRSLGGLNYKSQHIIVNGGDANGHSRVVLPRNLCAPHLRTLLELYIIGLTIINEFRKYDLKNKI